MDKQYRVVIAVQVIELVEYGTDKAWHVEQIVVPIGPDLPDETVVRGAVDAAALTIARSGGK